MNRSDTGKTTGRSRKCLLEALLASALFYLLTVLSRIVPEALHAVALVGLLSPLIWGILTEDWVEMGFRADDLIRAVAWGVGTGLIACLIGYMTVAERALAADVGVQLAVGVPVWLLLASPFQEFFFRGWLQPRWERGLGSRWGLVVATIGFTGWHYLLPIFGQSARSSFPLYSVQGLAATLGAGLAYGYGFQRTGNIVTPWLAHALSGILFVALGSSSFLLPGP